MVRGMFWLMLLIISAKMAYSLWRYFSFSAEYTAVSSSVNKPLRADAKPFDKNDVQLVSQQNWFGKYQPVAAPVNNLNLRLWQKRVLMWCCVGSPLVPDPAW